MCAIMRGAHTISDLSKKEMRTNEEKNQSKNARLLEHKECE